MSSREYEHNYYEEYDNCGYQNRFSQNNNKELNSELDNQIINTTSVDKNDKYYLKRNESDYVFKDKSKFDNNNNDSYDDYHIKKEEENDSGQERDISLKMPKFERIICKTPPNDSILPDVLMAIFFIFLLSLPFIKVIARTFLIFFYR